MTQFKTMRRIVIDSSAKNQNSQVLQSSSVLGGGTIELKWQLNEIQNPEGRKGKVTKVTCTKRSGPENNAKNSRLALTQLAYKHILLITEKCN